MEYKTGQVRFPHVLTEPKQAVRACGGQGEYARIVTDKLAVGQEFTFTIPNGKDFKTQRFKVANIVAERPAKGDWSQWNIHPTYYECEMEFTEPLKK